MVAGVVEIRDLSMECPGVLAEPPGYDDSGVLL
jgi:hypothetical protein